MPEEKPQPPAAGAAGAAAAPKKKKKLIIIVGLAVVLVAGGVTAALLYRGGKKDKKEETKTTAGEIAADSEGGEKGAKGEGGEGHGGEKGEAAPKDAAAPAPTVYEFEHPFVVNLLDPTGRWFLQLMMQIETTTPEGVARVKGNIPPLRDTIIMLLSSKTKDEMSNTEGKLKLKQEMISRLDAVLGPGTVKAIYFTEFSFHFN